MARGRESGQRSMLALVDLEERIPANHPLRRIKTIADCVLATMSPTFDVMDAETGRPSSLPERLLKACLLMALYTVRSERAFCEELEYNLLYRWFLDMDLIEPGFDASTFSKNRERLLAHDVARIVFDAMVREADREHLISTEHFSVDGTIIASASAVVIPPRRRTIRATHILTLFPSITVFTMPLSIAANLISGSR